MPLFPGELDLPVPEPAAETFIEVYRRDAEGPWSRVLGPLPSTASLALHLNQPLATGQQIRYRRVQGDTYDQSEIFSVVNELPQLGAPRVVGDLRADQAVLRVEAVPAGVWAEVVVAGDVVGRARADQAGVARVPLPGGLPLGNASVRSHLPGLAAGPAALTPILATLLPAKPRILEPVALEDTVVWVSSVTPGVTLRIENADTGAVLGTLVADESLQGVAVCPVDGPVRAVAEMGIFSRASDVVDAVVHPAELGPYTVVEAEKTYDTVSIEVDGTMRSYVVGGRLFRPSTVPAGDPPLVVIMHGAYTGCGTSDSYRGYDYLGELLASKGMYVFSLAVDPSDLYPAYRADLLHETLDCLLNLDAAGGLLWSAAPPGLFTDSSIGLVGHSLGAEGVILAASRNEASWGLPIEAVASIAPTSWTNDDDWPDEAIDGTALLEIFGSDDYFFTDSRYHAFRPLHHYDRAGGEKSYHWVPRATHHDFNTAWTDPDCGPADKIS
ncbi:MAG: hypothetical protein R3F43_30730, partial [bacterium]